MKPPKFTQEQKDWICYQVGEWYLSWKNNLINWEEKTHRLGFAKEDLKSMICPIEKNYKVIASIFPAENELGIKFLKSFTATDVEEIKAEAKKLFNDENLLIQIFDDENLLCQWWVASIEDIERIFI